MLTSHKRCWLNVGTAYPVHTLVVPTPTLLSFTLLVRRLEELKNLQILLQQPLNREHSAAAAAAAAAVPRLPPLFHFQ